MREPAATSDAVDAFLTQLDHPRKPTVEAIRAIILGADPRITESVKWNAPSFSVGDHFATFKLRPDDTVQVVFHTGAKKRPEPRPIEVDDPSGWLRWAAPDRCLATFTDEDDVAARRSALTALVQQWLAQTEDLR